MFTFRHKGDFTNSFRFLNNIYTRVRFKRLHDYGAQGVEALRSVTPKRTGLTANSWRYEVREKRGQVVLSFHNDNIQNGVPIAIILHYGHATRNGGYVQGREYINSAVQPIFDRIADELWREVTNG